MVSLLVVLVLLFLAIGTTALFVLPLVVVARLFRSKPKLAAKVESAPRNSPRAMAASSPPVAVGVAPTLRQEVSVQTRTAHPSQPLVVEHPPKNGTQVDLPYRKKDYLLTRAERSFYEALQSAIGSQVSIFSKVRLVDLLYLPERTQNRQAHLNRVISKHVDFVLCDARTVTPLLVIELNDSSHEREDRQMRDLFVGEALEAASLPILWVRVQRSYNLVELAQQIEQAVGRPLESSLQGHRN